MLATAQTQTRCNGNHWLALAIELQCQDLTWRQHHRRPLGRLLKDRPCRMHVGEGAASKALARQTLHARQSDECGVEQPMSVGAVAQGVVDPPVVGGE